MNDDLESHSQIFASKSFSEVIGILIVLGIGMLINWGVEALKWKLVVQKAAEVSFTQAYKAVLVGNTYGIFTPNRVGEIIGRVFFIKSYNKSRIGLLTLAGSASMTMGGMVIACLSLHYFLEDSSLKIFYLAGAWLGLSLIFYAYLNMYNILKRIVRFKWWKKYADYASTLKLLSIFDLIAYVFLSIFRYSIFVIQYYIFLQFFVADISIPGVASNMSLIFFIQSFVPTPVVIELGIRGNLAVLFLADLVNGNTLLITSVAYMIWFINMLVPALIGYIFVLRKK
jgi:hypothetical protein